MIIRGISLPIHAKLPDGTILKFPDGTEQTVVDKAVKSHLGTEEVPETPASSLMARVSSKIPAVVSETASAINRGITGAVDFIPAGINEAGRQLGFNTDLPTATEALQMVDEGFGAKNFMEPGIARTVTQQGGEFLPGLATAAAGGRKIAKEVGEQLLTQAPSEAASLVSKSAQSALKQGIGDNVVREIQGSSPRTKVLMRRMVGILESSRGKSRPSDVIGDSVARRISKIADVNRKAGRQLDVEARKLAGKDVDLTGAFHQFTEDLSKNGVTFGDDAKLVFDNSTFDGTKSSENFLTLLSRRLQKVNDAQDAHRLKRFIDDKVSFGEGGEGVSGATENVAKGLRRAIDHALDTKFDKYREINDTFSETIGALNQFQDVAGKRIPLSGDSAGTAIGSLSRRLLSNAQSRANLRDALGEIDRVAGRHGANVDDDLESLVLFANELDRMFQPAAKTSLAGEVAKEFAREGQSGLIARGVEEGVKKVRRINDEEALKALRALLPRE